MLKVMIYDDENLVAKAYVADISEGAQQVRISTLTDDGVARSSGQFSGLAKDEKTWWLVRAVANMALDPSNADVDGDDPSGEAEILLGYL